MARKKRKPKAGHQQPKKRKPQGSGGGSITSSSGTMSGLRGMFKKTVRGGSGADAKKPPSKIGRVVDILLWIAVAGAIVYFIANTQCAG